MKDTGLKLEEIEASHTLGAYCMSTSLAFANGMPCDAVRLLSAGFFRLPPAIIE